MTTLDSSIVNIILPSIGARWIALAGYDLTADEKAALKSGNAAKLHELGVDERVTKSILFDDERGRG